MTALIMQETSWQGNTRVPNQVMLSNGPEMSGVRHPNAGAGQGVRSQDDANVGYFFQRPQTNVTQQFQQKRWAVGDDSVLEQGRNVNDLEREFQNITFHEQNRAEMGGPKKLWEDEKAAGDAANRAGGGFPPGPWSREDGWNPNHAAPPPHIAKQYMDPSILHPGAMPHLRRPGSFPGDQASVLSPRSSETGALGVNMAEYVLGGSPVGNRRLVAIPTGGGIEQQQVPVSIIEKSKGVYEAVSEKAEIDPTTDGQSIQVIQNGLEDDKYRAPGSRQNSPTEGEVAAGQPAEPQLQAVPREEFVPHSLAAHHPAAAHQQQQQQTLHLEAPQFEPQLGIDPFPPVDYSTQFGGGAGGGASVQSMDSPNFNIDYSQLQQAQRPVAFLTQQQYLAAQQQQQVAQQLGALGGGGQASLPAQYVLNAQDQFVSGMPMSSQTILPQYYGVQAPWSIYPGGLLQQQQQQQQQQGAVLSGQHTPQGAAAPTAAAQQGQLFRGHTPRSLTPSQSGEGLGTPTGQPQALHTPGGTQQYPVVAPAYYDQSGQLIMGNGRGIGTPLRLISPAPILMNTGQGATGPIQIMTNQGQQIPVATVPMSQDAASANQRAAEGERRGSFTGSFTDYKRQNQMLGQYYNALGQASTSPAGPMGLVQASTASLTPPPSLGGSISSLALGGVYDFQGIGAAGRVFPAAPGAEAKYRNGVGLPTAAAAANGLFGNSLFNPKLFAPPKNQLALSKEVTGRSRLLEDFRNNRIPNPQLKDLVNHVVEFSQDQHGSRFIQQKLERATPAEKQMVFNEILTAAYNLMTDVFGNYVIQKFFEFGAPEQKQTLAQRVRGHVLALALQMYGCRVIQKALESIPTEMQVEIVKELDGHVLKCVKDQNGNHVVQKCIESIDPKHLDFLLDAFNGQVLSLSTHPYGCRVIQRVLEHCNPDQIGPILDELFSQTERLVQDQYGNYVIQHVLEHGRPDEKIKVVAIVRGKMCTLSQHKFASNVVEKCIAHAGRNERAILIEEVCAMNDGLLFTMMKDQFANYVIQKMIDVAEPPQRKMLLHKIRPHVAALRKFTYGKHILAKLEKFYMKTNQELGPIGMPPNGALP